MKTVNVLSSRWFVVPFLVSCSMAARAANIVWTNTAGGNWNVTNNWSPNQLPGSADTAIITNAGTYTVTFNITTNVAGLVLGTASGVTTQTFSINTTFTLNGQVTGTSNGLLNFNGATLAGAPVVAGTLNVVGGTLSAGASLTVGSTAVMNLLAGGGTFVISGTLTNSGIVNWLGGGLQVNNNNTASEAGAIWNQAGAQWYIQYSGTLTAGYNTGYEIFNNAGLLCRTNVAGSINIQVYLNNTGGTVQAQIGTILISEGCNLAGTFQAASGAAIDFTGGNFIWNGTAVFEGPGSVAITGGTVTVPNPISSPLALGGGTLINVSNLLGSAYLTNIYIQQAETVLGTNINWAGTSIPYTASLTIASNATLNLVAGGNAFVISGPLTNSGTVNWLAGGLQVNNNNSVGEEGVIWNQAGAKWYIQVNGTFIAGYNTGYEIFNNAGLLCKTNVSGTTTLEVYLNNTGGTVQAQIGTIDFSGGCNLAGVFLAESGTAIDFTGGNYLWYGTAVFEGAGSVAITGGTVTVPSPITSPLSLNGVTLINVSNLLGSAYLTNVNIQQAETIVGTNIDWAGTSIPHTASLTIASNATLNLVAGGNAFLLSGPLTNSGTVNWLAGGLQVNNNNTVGEQGAIWNQAGAKWYIQYSGTLTAGYNTGYEIFNNAGLLCRTNVAGSINVQIVLSNTTGTVDAEIGTIDFSGAYTLGAGGTLSFGLNSLSSFGTITLANTAALNGTISAHLNGGYVPIVSNAFTLLSYGAFTGGFTNTNLPSVAIWQTNEAATAYTIKVLKLVPQLKWPEPANIVYGAKLTNVQLDATAASPTNLAGTLAGAFAYAPTNGTVLDSGSNRTLSVTFTPTDTANNSTATTNVTINVLQAPLTITATNRTKTYGQTETFAGTEFVPAGLTNGDTITSASITSAGDPPTAVVSGSPYTITVTNAVGDAGLTNYIITYDTGNLTVNQAVATVTANAQGKIYGQTVPFGSGSMLFTASTLSNSETIGTVTLTVTGNGGVGNAPVGTYKITPSAATGGSGTEANYNITYMTNTLTVSAAPLTVTAEAQIKTYGQIVAFGSGSTLFTASLSNNETIGTVTLAVSGNGGASNTPMGNYTITASAATGGSGTETNYSISYVTNTLFVNPAPLTVTAKPQSKTYGQTVAFGSGSTQFTASLSNNETIGSVTLAVTGNGGVSNAPVGNYSITPSAATGGSGTETNYSITYLTNTLTVNPGTLTITADSQNKTYGQTVAFGSGSLLFTASTLSNNETVGTVTLAVSGNGGAGSAPVGSYTITPSAATGGSGTEANYNITYVTNILAVGSAPLIVTANPQGKNYGQTVAFGSGSTLFMAALSNSETIGSVTLAVTGNGGASDAPIGNYKITPSAATGGSGTETNYTITYVTNTLTVSAAPLTVTADPQSKTYGQKVVFGSGSTLFTAALSNNETIGTVTLAVSGNGGASNAPAGSYTITPSAAAGGSGTETNYSITYVTNTLTVTLPTLYFVADPPNMVLSWTTNASAFVLNFTTNLAPLSTWTPINNGITINGTNYTITVPDNSGNDYFSLIAP
jgi:hypothetical protein